MPGVRPATDAFTGAVGSTTDTVVEAMIVENDGSIETSKFTGPADALRAHKSDDVEVTSPDATPLDNWAAAPDTQTMANATDILT